MTQSYLQRFACVRRAWCRRPNLECEVRAEWQPDVNPTIREKMHKTSTFVRYRDVLPKIRTCEWLPNISWTPQPDMLPTSVTLKPPTLTPTSCCHSWWAWLLHSGDWRGRKSFGEFYSQRGEAGTRSAGRTHSLSRNCNKAQIHVCTSSFLKIELFNTKGLSCALEKVLWSAAQGCFCSHVWMGLFSEKTFLKVLKVSMWFKMKRENTISFLFLVISSCLIRFQRIVSKVQIHTNSATVEGKHFSQEDFNGMVWKESISSVSFPVLHNKHQITKMKPPVFHKLWSSHADI